MLNNTKTITSEAGTFFKAGSIFPPGVRNGESVLGVEPLAGVGHQLDLVRLEGQTIPLSDVDVDDDGVGPDFFGQNFPVFQGLDHGEVDWKKNEPGFERLTPWLAGLSVTTAV